jgi:uncharacterized membrane protein YbhN (UPF0104 family)
LNKLSGLTARRAVYRSILFALTIVAVSWFAAHNLKEISRYELHLRVPLIAFSFCAVLSAYLARFAVWTRLSSAMDLRAPVWKAGRAYFLSILGRYIPGKVGLALIRVEAYRGYQPDTVVMATGLELMAALSAAFLLALVGLASSPDYVPPYLRWVPLVALVPLLVALSPKLLQRTANAILRLLKRSELDRLPPYSANIAFVVLYTIPGFLHGLGLFLLLNAFSEVPGSHYLAVTGAYYAANLIGLLAVFAPGGLGVREGVLFLVLPTLVGTDVAIIAALLIRLITMAAEVVLAAAFSAGAARIR